MGANRPIRRGVGCTAFLIILGGQFVSAADVSTRSSGNVADIRLRPVPKIVLAHGHPTSQPSAQLRKHIKELAGLRAPYWGICPALGYASFAPISESEQRTASLFTNQDMRTPPGFVELVTAGPSALPLLLDALDDQTPTQLVIRHDSYDGGMWFARELFSNAMNPFEASALTSVPKAEFSDSLSERDAPFLSRYTVKVGDVCFVLIGQIVGREYLALRYQPTGCTVISSATEDRIIRDYLRAAWSGSQPAQRLLDSLLIDFSTESDSSRNGWSDGYLGNELQISATTRLLFYFPDQTAGLIAECLRQLEASVVDAKGGSAHSNAKPDALARPHVADGTRLSDFIQALAWCKVPVIRTELLNLLRRTRNPSVLLASLPEILPEQQDLAFQRLLEFLANLPLDDRDQFDGPFGDGYRLLLALGNHFGARARPAFERYLERPSLMRRRSMSHVLRDTCGQWSGRLLLPLLDDQRDTDCTYAVTAGAHEPRRPIRVCDEAAETIARWNPGVTFTMVGEHARLDEQIAAMKTALASTKPATE